MLCQLGLYGTGTAETIEFISAILMTLGISDMWTRGYKVLEWILNICINYANKINFRILHNPILLPQFFVGF